MNRRRLMLGIGAALLVGGWGTTQLASQEDRVVGGYTGRSKSDRDLRNAGLIENQVVVWDWSYRGLYRWGIASMAIGAGLIGFAVLRPTNRKVE